MTFVTQLIERLIYPTVLLPPVPPTISGEHVQDADAVRNLSVSSIVDLSCDVTGSPTPSLYWYKNGQDISPQTVQSASMNYIARGIDSSTLLGIYQCFAVNRGGVAYRIFRVLEFGKLEDHWCFGALSWMKYIIHTVCLSLYVGKSIML